MIDKRGICDFVSAPVHQGPYWVMVDTGLRACEPCRTRHDPTVAFAWVQQSDDVITVKEKELG